METGKFDIPEEYGGNTPENVQKVRSKLDEIGPPNSHLHIEELTEVAIGLVFSSPEKGQRVGGT